jgi:hypothetical protein
MSMLIFRRFERIQFLRQCCAIDKIKIRVARRFIVCSFVVCLLLMIMVRKKEQGGNIGHDESDFIFCNTNITRRQEKRTDVHSI